VTRPWQTLDRVDTPEGPLELRQRGEREFVITVAGRVLMNSALHLTEDAAAEIACKEIADRPHPRVLIGGLGLGFTLRAALDALPRRARVTVSEITPAVVRWCRGPLAHLTDNALADRRVTVRIEDVAATLAQAARAGGEERFDAIVLDLYEGPRSGPQAKHDPLWGDEALRTTRKALEPEGVLTVWSEDPDPSFPRRLRLAGFDVETKRPGKGGPRHLVYVAHPSGRLSRNPRSSHRPK
jgi:spermidine synthase